MDRGDTRERRQDPRVELHLLVRVRGGDGADGSPWTEITTTTDASAGGVGLVLDHRLAVGQVVQLEVLTPLPKSLGVPEATTHPLYGVVRSAVAEGDAGRVGVMFLERHIDFDSLDSEHDRRRSERFAIRVNFIVQQVDAAGVTIKEGLSVAEDISRGGAQLVAALGLTPGDVVLLREVGGAFEARAEITRTWLDGDGLRRLHLRFLDGRSPDHVVPTA